MKNFKSFINENALSPDEFIEKVQESFLKHFPNGYVKIVTDKGLVKGAITAWFGMIGNTKDNTNGIAENDKMRHSFVMFPNKDLSAYEFKGSGRIYINPEEGSHMAMSSIKTGMGNNSSITLDKALIKMEKFFSKLSGLMKDNVDNIYGVDKIDKKYLIFK